MPHFVFDSNEDGTIRRVLKDGEPYQEAVKLEQLSRISLRSIRATTSHPAFATLLLADLIGATKRLETAVGKLAPPAE